MTRRKNPSIEALYTDIQWIKSSIAEIKESIRGINESYVSIQQRLSSIETRMRMHDRVIYAIVGGTITGFISLVVWILSTL